MICKTANPSTSAEQFVGGWRLDRFTSTSQAGEVTHPLGQRPRGLISYTANGFMAAHLMRDAAGGGAEMPLYTSYYGTFWVDSDRAMVCHDVLGASVAGLAGTVQERAYRFADNQLVLSAHVSGKALELVWISSFEEQE